jgi:hypothetical protein
VRAQISGCKGDACPPSPPGPPGPPGPPSTREPCLGEFTRCASGECTMSSQSCGGGCKTGEYVCPSDQKTCVPSAAAYSQCPGMAGTHLDHTLDIEKRLDYIVAHTNLTEQIQQLQNKAPEIFELGISEYQWLNDDQHGAHHYHARCALLIGWLTTAACILIMGTCATLCATV